jgi:hypothetical protein
VVDASEALILDLAPVNAGKNLLHRGEYISEAFTPIACMQECPFGLDYRSIIYQKHLFGLRDWIYGSK